MSASVIVDFGVSTDATGDIRVFGQTAPTITNKTVAATKMDYRLLYGGPGTALIEFQGSGNDIIARTVSEFTQNLDNKPAFAAALHNVLTNGNLDATGAVPFSNLNNPLNPTSGLRYANSNYRNYMSFGELALAAFAHVYFGHVDATAAIDNDTTFISKMNGTNEMAGEANLSGKLTNLIFGLSDSQCASIAKQVIGQDASRAMAVDNDGPDTWQKLQFKPGDKFYVKIVLTRPTVTVTDNNLAQQREPPAALYSSLPSDRWFYMIEIELYDPTILLD